MFSDGLGCISKFKAKLNIQPDFQPKFRRPRSVPFATEDAVGLELNHLETEGIIEKVNHSDWATPIVPVPKEGGRFWVCGDYKEVTVNLALHVDQYSLPKPDDLFATLAGGKKFTKLDLSQAYLQLELDEESSKMTTVIPIKDYNITTSACHLESHLHLQCSSKSWIRFCKGFHALSAI